MGAVSITFIWFLLLPWIIRRIYVPGELAADANAIAFSLISDQELANAIVNRVGIATESKVGPVKILSILDGILSHPFLNEQLRNIGFEVKKPIDTKRMDKT